MSTFVSLIVTDAALCETCRRLVTGEMGDPKVHYIDLDEEARILCTGCARRTGVGTQLVGVIFRSWVETGDLEALREWRAMWGIRRYSVVRPAVVRPPEGNSLVTCRSTT